MYVWTNTLSFLHSFAGNACWTESSMTTSQRTKRLWCSPPIIYRKCRTSSRPLQRGKEGVNEWLVGGEQGSDRWGCRGVWKIDGIRSRHNFWSRYFWAWVIAFVWLFLLCVGRLWFRSASGATRSVTSHMDCFFECCFWYISVSHCCVHFQFQLIIIDPLTLLPPAASDRSHVDSRGS